MYIILALAICFVLPSTGFTTSKLSISRFGSTQTFAVVSIITKEQLDEIISSNTASGKPAIVDFQKSQCKPCIRIAPEFEKLAEKYEQTVSFYKVDADSSKEALGLLKQEGVRSVPTFQIYFAGEKVDRVQGAHLDQVEEILEGILNSKN